MMTAEADHTHVEATEARDALADDIGHGTPETAPDMLLSDPDWEQAPSWRPTRKWWAATVTGAAGILTLFATHGWHFDEETTIPLITIVAQRAVAFIIPNEEVA